MTRDRFLHILRFLHFADNSQRTDQSEEYDRLWKLRTVFDTLDDNYAKFYNLSENLAVDEVIVKYRGRVIFRQYTCAMRVYLGKDSQSATDDMTATSATVRYFTRRVEGHKLFWTISFRHQDFLMTWTDIK